MIDPDDFSFEGQCFSCGYSSETTNVWNLCLNCAEREAEALAGSGSQRPVLHPVREDAGGEACPDV